MIVIVAYGGFSSELEILHEDVAKRRWFLESHVRVAEDKVLKHTRLILGTHTALSHPKHLLEMKRAIEGSSFSLVAFDEAPAIGML